MLNNFKKCLSIKVIKIVLDSMLYETLKWPQIAPFCISSKKNPRPPPPLKNYGVHTIKPQLRPWDQMNIVWFISQWLLLQEKTVSYIRQSDSISYIRIWYIRFGSVRNEDFY